MSKPREWIFTRNRSLGPIVIIGLLVVFYFVNCYLPQEWRDFLQFGRSR